MSIEENLSRKFSFYRAWQAQPGSTIWNFIILIILSLVALGVVLLTISAIYKTPTEVPPRVQGSEANISTDPNLKVAFFGDEGLNENSRKVLTLVKQEKADMVLYLGDFDYEDSPELWDKQINDTLGRNFPLFAVAGNHELKQWPAYQRKLTDRLGRIPGALCEGVVGVKATCHYRGLFFIETAPNVLDIGHDIFIRDALSLDRSIWSICMWHKNMHLLQIGARVKPDETGWGVFEECRKGGGIVTMGHDHSYARTYLMDSFNTPHISATTSPLVVSPGKTFAVISGLGGKSMNFQELSNPWWAAIYNRTQKGNYGAFFCTFNVGGNARRADCYFKDIDGKVPDRFSVESNVTN